MGFPVWIIAVVMAIVVVLFSLICYLIISRRRRNASPAVDAVDTIEKAIGTTVVTAHLHQQEKTPLPLSASLEVPKDVAHINRQSLSSPETEYSNSTTDDTVSLPPSRKSSGKQQRNSNRINLPLPPPSTSLFSDKMELSSDEAMELFDKYVNVELDKSATVSGGFTANIQQKAATLRSTMRQSLRRQKSTNKPAIPLQDLFDSSVSGSETNSTTESTPSLVEKHSMPSIRTINTDRPVTPGLTTPSMPNTPVLRPFPQTPIPVSHEDDMPEEAVEGAEPPSTSPPLTADGAAMNAARRVIRTASRKSKTRSMLVSEDDVLTMFNLETSTAAAAVTGKNSTVRRLVRDSIVNEKSATVRTRGPSRATGTSVRHLAERWNNNTMPSAAATVAGRVQQHAARVSAQDLFESRKTTEQQHDEDTSRGNVDNVRKMLQATWQANLRESGSMVSIVSTTEAAIAAGSNHHSSDTVRHNPILRNSTQSTLQDVASTTSCGTTPVTSVASLATQEKIEIDGTNFANLGSQNQTWNVGRRSTANKNVCTLFQKDQDANELFSTVGRHKSNRQRKVSPWADQKPSISSGNDAKAIVHRECDNYQLHIN
ncbi:hypothetical protein BX666DRAFT_804754 [Dichotomocladium elegans]|nr:hypothetical protein BX666DRAFT_804754 [Dichotomocladium elegans]